MRAMVAKAVVAAVAVVGAVDGMGRIRPPS
jgi:hypothetical protein